MKIAIDVSQVVYGTGVSTYTQNLVEQLLTVDTKNSYTLFAGSLRQREKLHIWFSSLPSSVEKKTWFLPPRVADLLWNRLHLFKIDSLLGNPDILHSSDWTQPFSKAYKVTTIHDLAPIKYPQYTNPKIVAVHTRRLAWVKREVDSIIVPSQTIKDELVQMNFEPNRIEVIPEGVNPSFKPASISDIEKTKTRYKLSYKYLISVGAGPRKNTKRIIKAFEQIRKNNMNLVIVGTPQIEFRDTPGVRFLGHIPTPDLINLYSGAEALVYPALYEGFGLPILEGYATGCPVVTSNLSSMLEIAGKSAVLVDPEDVNSIADGIESAIRKRKSLVEKGLEEVKKYSWRKCALATLEVYMRQESRSKNI